MTLITMRYATGFAGTFLLLAAAGCQSDADAVGPKPGLCDRQAAEALAGRDRITDDEAKRLTGATMVRQVKPGDPVTMDFRQERVTIETDPNTGKIVRAVCG